MTSPSYSFEILKRNDVPFTLSKRFFLVILVCCIQMIYIPTSNQISGGMEPKLPIDVFPIWPIWVVPYVLCYPLWVSSFLWILLKTDDRSFRAFIVACMLTFAVGVATFIFFPTYVEAASLQGKDVFTSFLRFIHENWGRYDALPSGHIYITTLLALFFSRWYPRQKPFWIMIVLIVSLSTLFTGQHYILDVVSGYAVAVAGYSFGLWWAGFFTTQKRTDKRNGRRIPSSSLN